MLFTDPRGGPFTGPSQPETKFISGFTDPAVLLLSVSAARDLVLRTDAAVIRRLSEATLTLAKKRGPLSEPEAAARVRLWRLCTGGDTIDWPRMPNSVRNVIRDMTALVHEKGEAVVPRIRQALMAGAEWILSGRFAPLNYPGLLTVWRDPDANPVVSIYEGELCVNWRKRPSGGNYAYDIAMVDGDPIEIDRGEIDIEFIQGAAQSFAELKPYSLRHELIHPFAYAAVCLLNPERYLVNRESRLGSLSFIFEVAVMQMRDALYGGPSQDPDITTYYCHRDRPDPTGKFTIEAIRSYCLSFVASVVIGRFFFENPALRERVRACVDESVDVVRSATGASGLSMRCDFRTVGLSRVNVLNDLGRAVHAAQTAEVFTVAEGRGLAMRLNLGNYDFTVRFPILLDPEGQTIEGWDVLAGFRRFVAQHSPEALLQAYENFRRG